MKKQLNIIIPLFKNDFSFNKEFCSHKYLTKIGVKKKLIEFTLNSIQKLNKNFSLNLYFVLNNNDNEKLALKKEITKKKNLKKKIIFIGKSKSIIETCLKAGEYLNKDYPTLIFHPDSYSKIDQEKFNDLLKKNHNAVLFGYKGFNPVESVNSNTDRFTTKNKTLVKKIYLKSRFSEEMINTAGLFYFSSFNIFEKYSKKVLSKKNYKLKITSEVFQEMIASGLEVSYLIVKLFVNFSNINAVNEFLFWKKYFLEKKTYPKKKLNINNIIPAAGLGIRHKNLYKKHKPFISIDNKPMINWAIKSLPVSEKNYFIFHKKISLIYKKEIKELRRNIKRLNIVNINKKTKGMAITCLKLENLIDKKLPIFISSCDYSFLLDEKKLHKLLKQKPDAIIFTFKKYPDARIDPNSYAYVKVRDNKIINVAEKKTISKHPNKDYAVVGTFYFKDWNTFDFAVKKMIEAKNSVNNEYYVATAINELIDRKFKVCNFEVSSFISWSLPHHTLTYFYWLNIFNNYRIEIFK